MAGRAQTGADLPVRFGTSGFRGVLGEDFTFERARALVAELAGQVKRRKGSQRVVVAYDTRFLADRFAEHAAEVLHAAGLSPWLAAHPTPTPAACYAVRRRRAAAGVILTASHNPPAYQGLKVVGPDGSAAPRAWTDALERGTARRLAAGREPGRKPWAQRVDLCTPYRQHLSRLVPPLVGSGVGLRMVYDPLHGAGAQVMQRWLTDTGCTVTALHEDPDPLFGGGPPDPSAARLTQLGAEVRRRRARFGLASDGDADRFAVVDGRGRRVPESDALALLIDHLAREGRLRAGVALSVATGSLPERVAESYGLPVRRVGLGFKVLSAELAAGRADAAGEESGGFAWAPGSLDKDGLLAGALLVERLGGDRRPVAEQVRALQQLHGAAACGRHAVAATPARLARLAALEAAPPRRFDDGAVRGVWDEDGLHCRLEDGGFVMWRASGTEPVIRVYAEARSRAGLARRLRRAVARLDR